MISINKYMQKTGEPENDAGFLKHIYSQLNCNYSNPSKPRLVVRVFRLHIYASSEWLLTQPTHTRHPYSNSMCKLTRALVMYFTPIYIAYIR